MNINRSLLLVFLLVVVQAVNGQKFFTQGASPNLHMLHKVGSKETWYSLGKSYNLTPQEIATFNKMSMDMPLAMGQTVMIPLTSKNFVQEDMKGSVDDFAPVYHEIQEKEWMYRISVNHNKVPIEKLEKWNGITFDQAKPGMKLIVGYLNVKNSNIASNVESIPTDRVSGNSQAAIKDPVIREGGYFRTYFAGNGKNKSGVSGIFKSTSGWNDGKYYALMNNVTVGTIVKINLPETTKSIYAKVLGELPDMKESAGLALRISDAAARELGAVENKFSVDIKY